MVTAKFSEYSPAGFEAPLFRSTENSTFRAAVEVTSLSGEEALCIFEVESSTVSPSLTDILEIPGSLLVCVVVRGSAFLVNPNNLRETISLPASGQISGSYTAEQAAVLLLHTPWEVLALDDSGFKWITRRTSAETLELNGEGPTGVVRGTADPDYEDFPFEIDLHTGKVTGGNPAFE